jgi:hypothetical protein
LQRDFLIVCEGEAIGSSDLEARDPGMGTARGRFFPLPAYDRVRHVFRIFAESQHSTGAADADKVSKYYSARDQLHLTVETRAGRPIPADTVHISDFRDEIDEEACEVDVYLSDRTLFEENS